MSNPQGSSLSKNLEQLQSGIAMFSTAACPYCIKAERFLNSKGAQGIVKLRIDEYPELRELMAQACPGSRTVPQIFIAGEHIGGCDDLLELARAKPERLAQLLAASGSARS